MESKKARKGSSLLVSLLALTLVTVVATKVFMSVDQQSKILTTSMQQDEALTYLLAGESWAEQMLLSDGLDFGEESNLITADFELDDGQLLIRVLDLQSCININKLAEETSKEEARGRLKSLSSALSVDHVWIDILSDWVDADSELTGGGKESFDYLSAEPPYQAANAEMFGDYEWNMLDIDNEELEEVIPYVCSLPDSSSQLNINTVSATILQAMLPNITDTQISYIATLTEAGDIESIEELTSHATLANLSWVDSDWSLGTDFVAILVTLEMNDKRFWLHSEIAKNHKGIVKPYFRSMMPPNNIVKTRFSIKEPLNES